MSWIFKVQLNQKVENLKESIVLVTCYSKKKELPPRPLFAKTIIVCTTGSLCSVHKDPSLPPHPQQWVPGSHGCLMRPLSPYPTLIGWLWTCDSCWANENPYPGCLELILEDYNSFWIHLLKGDSQLVTEIIDYYGKVLFPQWPQEYCSLGMIRLAAGSL